MAIFEEEPGDYEVPPAPWEYEPELPPQIEQVGGEGGSGYGGGGDGGGEEPPPERPPREPNDAPEPQLPGPELPFPYNQINPATGQPYGVPHIGFPWDQTIPGTDATYQQRGIQALQDYYASPDYLHWPASRPLPGTSYDKLQAYYDNPDYLHWPAPSPAPPSGPALPQPVKGPTMTIQPRGGSSPSYYSGPSIPPDVLRQFINLLRYGGIQRI